MPTSGAELSVKSLETNGVKYVFGVPGGHLLKFYDALHGSRQVTPILTKHESGASFMAAGFAQVSGKIGVCTGTVGPGALQEATGEGRTIDHVELFDGMTKYSTRVSSASRLTEAFRNAFRLATSGRPGPVHLDVMAHVFLAETETDADSFEKNIERFPMSGHRESIVKAAELIASAKKPAILAGAGAMEASREIVALAEKYGIPVATTLRGKGVGTEDHALCLGLYGTNAATHSWDKRYQPTSALIQVDADSWEIGKNYPVSIGIIGDAKPVMRELLERMEDGEPAGTPAGAKEVRDLKRREGTSTPPKCGAKAPR